MRRRLPAILTMLGIALAVAPVAGDTFTYLDESQQTRTVDGTLIASGRGFHLVGRADGQYQLIPLSRLQMREAGDDPAPISPEGMADLLREAFGDDRIRIRSEAPYVVGLVLAGPLAESSTAKVDGFLRNAARFMKNVETVFSKFCRELRLETSRPEYPLVLLIFETDRDFDNYAGQVTGGQGLAAENMAGFYSPLSNWLAIRIGECRTFQVPLHEAIHQQVHNRGLLQRLAGVPVWFNEGIATGFENDGGRINVGPTKINAMYARMVPQAKTLDWHEVFVNDSTFTGDVLAGEAYVHAWSMHWLLVTQHRREYAKYLESLGQIEPLAEVSPAAREQQFVEAFGKTISEVCADFPRLLKAGMKAQKIDLSDAPDTRRITQGDASEVELTSVQRVGEDGLIEVCGELRNVSPFREFAYYVRVQTDGGLYAEWHLQSVESLSSQALSSRLIEKPVSGGPGQTGEHLWVDVKCALPDSAEAERWRRGEFPRPAWNDPAG